MNANFPAFERLHLKHRNKLQTFAKRYLPYSDFNFVSMYTYNTDDSAAISMLNGNLVLKFLDYMDDTPFFTFLGNKDVEKTVDMLTMKAKDYGFTPVLKLVPEDSLKNSNIDSKKYDIQEDRDNFDYIYSLKDISELHGKNYEMQRNLVNRFTRRVPDFKVEALDMKDPFVREEILRLCEKWNNNKGDSDHSFDREFNAIKRAVDVADILGLVCLGIWIDGKLAAFSISEYIPNYKYVVAHYRKADVIYPGIYQYMEHETASYLYKLGAEFMNYEQDLGIEGLRRSKSSWNPVYYLKKYTITPKK